MIIPFLVLFFTITSSVNAKVIMQYPNMMNRDMYKKINSSLDESKKIMTIFETSTYSLDTIKKILEKYDPNLIIIPNKESRKLILLHTKEQSKTLKSMLKKLNLSPTKISIKCHIYEINNELENELNLLTTPLENGAPLNYRTLADSISSLSLTDTIKTLEKNGHASLIAQPHFEIENGKTATLTIGEKIPYLNTIFNQTSQREYIQHIQTGLDISITATIVSENQIQTTIECDLSTVKLWKNLNDKTYPVLASRKIKLDTLLIDKQKTLITQFNDELSKTYQTKNPFIKKIPIINKLTGHKTKQTSQTSLCLLIETEIIRLNQKS